MTPIRYEQQQQQLEREKRKHMRTPESRYGGINHLRNNGGLRTGQSKQTMTSPPSSEDQKMTTIEKNLERSGLAGWNITGVEELGLSHNILEQI